MFKHILVPVDGSELSGIAIHHAVEFAHETGAKITFFHVQPDYPIAFYGEGALFDPTTPDKFAELTDTHAQTILANAQTQATQAGVTCATHTLTSDLVYLAIIDAATHAGCDLIFMASHGRRGISGFLLGSETQKVLTHSKIPVLVWR